MAEVGSEAIEAVVSASASLFASRITYVECVAALARLAREGRLRSAERSFLLRGLDDRWTEVHVVEFDENLARAAARVALTNPLKAADCIHLSSAIAVAESHPGDLRFASWDRRLREAARGAGMVIFPERLD